MPKREYRQDKLSKLAELCLRMANVIDRHGENGDYEFANEIGLGYLALSGYLRDGVKAIADMQMDYSDAVSMKNLAELSENEAREYLKDIFGEEDVDSLNETYKARIKEFVQSLFNEMDGDE